MDAIQRKCQACGEAFSGVSRRQKYCSPNCRPSAQNPFHGPTHPGAENPNLSCLQLIENIDAGSDHFEEFRLTRSFANFRFEEYPERPSKRAACVTYKLTDGQQINTGYGRASRALGYMMEVWPGRWVARVRDLASLPSSFTAAKQAAIDLYRSQKSGEPKDCIEELNQTVANEIDRAYWTREKRKWPVDLLSARRHRLKQPPLTIDTRLRGAILDTEHVLKDDEPIRHPYDKPVLECYDDGFPKIPECLDRRPSSLLAEAA
jgi:hypothetical protein